jgi:dTDP-3-amino-3,4,6-trideoxy-alpha-D-glucose transaminase
VPILCDIIEDDYTIDVSLVEELITDRTVAILPVDLYGHPANVRALRPIADRHGLKIVEDAALAAGSEDHSAPVGAFADVTVFSFAPFKPLGCVGNGAVAATNDDAVAERLQLLCGYGHGSQKADGPPGQQAHLEEGYNMPLDPLQAALLRTKLPHLEDWTRARRAVVAAYAEGLARANVRRPVFRPESRPTFRSYTILVEEQDRVHRELLERGIEVVLHYVPPTYCQPVYASSPPRGADRLPVTDSVTRRLLCLPVTPELTPTDVDYVVNSVREVVGS